MFATKTATALLVVAVAFCALLLLSSAETSTPPAAAEAPLERGASSSAVGGNDLANVLTFTPEQIASAESALNSTATAVFAAVNATRAAKAAFFQDAIATPFGQLKAGGLRAGGLVKRTNRTMEAKSDWLTSELALAPFAKAFSRVSAAVDASPVGKAFAATAKPSSAAASTGAGAGSLLPPTPRQVLARVSEELRLPGGGPAEDVAAAVAEAEKAGSAAGAAASSKAA